MKWFQSVIVCCAIILCGSGVAEAQQGQLTCAQIQNNLNDAAEQYNYWENQVVLRDAHMKWLDGWYWTIIATITNQNEPATPGQIQSLEMVTTAKAVQRIACQQAETNKAFWNNQWHYWAQLFAAQGC